MGDTYMKNIISKLMMLSVKMKVVVVASAIIVIAGVTTTIVLVNHNTKEQREKEVLVAENNENDKALKSEVGILEKETPASKSTTSENSVVKETEKEVKEETTEVAKVEENKETETKNDIEVMTPVTTTPNSEANVESTSNEDDLYHSWNKKATWTASNGAVLKVNDAWAEAVLSSGDGDIQALWTEDPEADWSPNSLYMDAVHEFIYGDPAYKNGTDRYNPEVVKVSDLPAVSTVSSKQASISVTPEFSAYKEQYDKLALFQATGNTEGSTTLYQLQVNNDFAGASVEGQGYMWDIRKNSDGGFKISIYRNLSELDFNGLLTVLKLITPDAQALYNEFYTQFYTGSDTFPAPGEWVTIGNSQAMADDGDGVAYFYFK